MKTKACKECRGEGRIYRMGNMLPDYCSYCNGTGIANDLRHWGARIVIASVVLQVAFFVWLFW